MAERTSADFFFLKHPPTVHSLGSALGVGPILVKRDSRGSVVAEVQIRGRRAIRRGLPRLRAVPTGNAAAGVAHARITQPTTREANRGGFALVRVREAWAVGVWGCAWVCAAAARSGRGLWLGLFCGDRNTAGSSRVRLLRPVFVQRALPSYAYAHICVRS